MTIMITVGLILLCYLGDAISCAVSADLQIVSRNAFQASVNVFSILRLKMPEISNLDSA